MRIIVCLFITITAKVLLTQQRRKEVKREALI